MISAEVERTLVKSPPELWTELGDPVTLARHLSELGEIRIVKAEPEKSVEWEAEAANGKVELKQSSWGTKVTLTITHEAPDAEPAPELVSEPAPDAKPEPEPAPAREPVSEPAPDAKPEPEPAPAREPVSERRRGFFTRIFKRRDKPVPVPADAQAPSPEEVAAQRAVAAEAIATQQAATEQAIAVQQAAAEEAIVAADTQLLNGILDRLGAAHHRPFSRG